MAIRLNNNYSYNTAFTAAPPYPNINIKNTTGFSTWDYGSRAIVTHLASSLNPTTQLNIAATYKNSSFTESGFDDIYSVSDRTIGVLGFQGINGGFVQNPHEQIVWRHHRHPEDCEFLRTAYLLGRLRVRSRDLFGKS